VESLAGQEILRELAAWQPEGDVVSAYVAVDPADRGEGWRTELRHQLDGLPTEAQDRLLARFPGDGPLPHGRTQVGFLELGGERREIWHGLQLDLDRTRVTCDGSPCLAPLVKLVDDGWPVGVVLVSLEIVRVLESALGEVEELDGWELEITSLDWRERKAPGRSADAGTGSSASGHDQYRQRLDHNRERFLKEAGQLIHRRYGDRDWRNVVVIGEGDRPQLLARGLGPLADSVAEVNQDLIRTPTSELRTRVADEIEHLNRDREERLIAKLREAIGTDAGAALGSDEVLECTRAGRAHQVLLDGEREWEERDGRALDELLIQSALSTSALVTPVEGLAARALAEYGGAAAILRY
jgi:hypothetical protein